MTTTIPRRTDARTHQPPTRRATLFLGVRLLALAAFALLPLGGCGTKVNEPNYYKVSRDMPADEVEELLGPGVDVTAEHPGVPAGWTVKRWEDDGMTFTVAFADGKVVARRAVGLSTGDDSFGWPAAATTTESPLPATAPASAPAE